ncbi:MAG: 3'-5' exonuclease [Spirochaetia bacterium]|jgi:ribonuclease D|nr:3'-5' exonuclease [Spirochaetia bacterium]
MDPTLFYLPPKRYDINMLSYTIIETDNEIQQLITGWKNDGLTSIAMDFEGEFNLHVYGEHLCLVQLYDTRSFYLIDPLKVSKAGLALLFEDGELEKIMFDCASDASLVRKEFGLQIRNVWDVRIPALALGFQGNYTSLVERNLGITIQTSGSKKKNQMTNWLKRPLGNEQIQYALLDVAYLHDLKSSLENECQAEGKTKEILAQMKMAGKEKNKPKPGWMKICNWKKLQPEEKVYLKYFFIARDTLARQWNVPPAKILDKRKLVQLCKAVPTSETEMSAVLSTAPKLLPLMMVAKQRAEEELKSRQR